MGFVGNVDVFKNHLQIGGGLADGMSRVFCVFFFQAEDGIRDLTVTGVQTCALPISSSNNAIAKPFNEATKYVVSHEPFEPDWVNTKVVSGDVPAALRRLKAEDGAEIGRASCRERV